MVNEAEQSEILSSYKPDLSEKKREDYLEWQEYFRTPTLRLAPV